MRRATRIGAAVVCMAAAGCRTIPLDGDPMMTTREVTRASPVAYFDVEWWKPLVKPALLEYQPVETASPAVDPDTERIIVCTRDGFVRSLSPIDGAVEWEHKVPTRCFAGATIVDGVAYLPAGDVLLAMRASTGEELWRYSAGEEIVVAPVVTPELILVATQSDGLFAVERNSGKWRWQYRRDAPSGFSVRGAAVPVVKGDAVFMGFSDGAMVSLALADGVQKWERNLTTSGGQQFLDADATPIVDDTGRMYAASFKDGVYELNAQTGDLKWVSARSGVSSLLSAGDVIFGAGDGKVHAIHAATGRVLWSLDLGGSKKSGGTTGRPPLMLRRLMAVPTASSLVFVDPIKGQAKLSWNPGKGVTATPTRIGRRLYVMSNLGTLFALSLRGDGG